MAFHGTIFLHKVAVCFLGTVDVKIDEKQEGQRVRQLSVTSAAPCLQVMSPVAFEVEAM